MSEYRTRPSKGEFKVSLEFEQHKARVEAGLTVSEYDNLPGTPQWARREGVSTSKCHVLMWYRQDRYLQLVSEDMQAREMERQAKHRRPMGRRF